MKKIFYLGLLLAFKSYAQITQDSPPLSNVKCDTLITSQGKTYLCQILRQNNAELQFSICGDSEEKVFVVSNQDIVALKKYRSPALKPPKPGEPMVRTAPQENQKNPQKATNPFHYLKMDVVQLTQKGAAFQYEEVTGPRGSLVVDFGIRWHNYISPGTQRFEYTKRVQHELLSSATSYADQPPIDFGEFVPRTSLHLALGPRIYLNHPTKNSLFLQPTLYGFFHKGLKITDQATLLSQNTSSYSGWYSSTSTTSYKWEVVRTAEKASRTSLGFAFSFGYRVLNEHGLVLELGTTLGNTFKGANDALQYYGLNDLYFRPFIMAGWKLP